MCVKTPVNELEILSGQSIERASAHTRPIEINGRSAALVTFKDDDGALFGWVQIAAGLIANDDFRRRWNQTWADLPFDFEWKPVPLHPYTAKTHPFFAVAYPATFRPADPTNFLRYLQPLGPDEQVASFSNLSGDAQLIVPKQTGSYGHLAQFCRSAPEQSIVALWQAVGAQCQEIIEQEQSIWCNTHGHGVPWLHVRFDTRLKYASFPPRGSISAISQAIWYKEIYPKGIGAP